MNSVAVFRPLHFHLNFSPVFMVSQTVKNTLFFLAGPVFSKGTLPAVNGDNHHKDHPFLFSAIADTLPPGVEKFEFASAGQYISLVEYFGSEAVSRPASERTDLYKSMRFYTDYVRYHFFSSSQVRSVQALENMIAQLWFDEYNEGAEAFNLSLIETEDATELLKTAVFHFRNTAELLPDSLNAYYHLVHIHSMLGDADSAIHAMEEVVQRKQIPSVDDFDTLIRLCEADERYNMMAEVSSTALELYPDELLFLQHLSSAKILSGETESGLEHLRRLIEQEPENPAGYLVHGANMYELASQHLEEAREFFQKAWQKEFDLEWEPVSDEEQVRNEIKTLLEQAGKQEKQGMELTNIVIRDFRKAIELRPDNHEAYSIIGNLYRNLASYYFGKKNFVPDAALAGEFQNQAEEYLGRALEQYQKAAELNPDNMYYQETLIDLYLVLGLEEEARALQEKYGF